MGQEWTRFRGPNGVGVSNASNLPTEWTEKDYNWKVRIRGSGHSQPVVWGERIFLASSTEEGRERHILCLGVSDGATEWSKNYSMPTHGKHRDNSYASSTPVVDEDLVYFVLASAEKCSVRAVTHDGKEERWSRELGPFEARHGHGARTISAS